MTMRLRDLLAALNDAGWEYRKDYLVARDADGAPWDEGTVTHEWTRGDERIVYTPLGECSHNYGYGIDYTPDGACQPEESAYVSGYFAVAHLDRLAAMAEGLGIIKLAGEA